jgi:hypothetical protein
VGKHCFFVKKQQKTFFNLGLGLCIANANGCSRPFIPGEFAIQSWKFRFSVFG